MCPLPVPSGCADSERLKFPDPHEPRKEDLLGAGFPLLPHPFHRGNDTASRKPSSGSRHAVSKTSRWTL